MNPDLLRRFVAIVGLKHALTQTDDLTHYTHENRDIIIGKTPLVLKPASTEEVAAIVKLAAETRTAIVPQGGHTGHAAGAVPDESGEQIVVSLERMNKIREIDLKGNVIVCDAGCVLETIQNVADEHERLFPLSLGSQGSCQIGGNISTNAGGTAVLSYGNTRQLVMGLEVVLPSGEIWNGLRRLKKDNTGYDLKDLFIGAEGTLGIVTAAVLKLFPKPKGKSVAFCGMQSVKQTVQMLGLARERSGNAVTAFEFLRRDTIEAALKHGQNVRNPLDDMHQWYVLLEISSHRSQSDADETMQCILEKALNDQAISDASIATNLTQQTEFWAIRETVPIVQKQIGGSIKHDISIPLHLIPAFLIEADALVSSEIPGIRHYTFGHLGDGNIHYNLSQPQDGDEVSFLAKREQINELVHKLTVQYEGSISAEHGIGKLKRDLLARTKDPVELELMRSIKKTLDPMGIMNPGKVV